MSVTFQVDDVERPKELRYRDYHVLKKPEDSLATLLGAKTNRAEAWGFNAPTGRDFLRVHINPFVSAALDSYGEHYPLELSPDAIWLTIAQGFAIHVNMNAEDLRKRFVQHEGKELIKVRRDEFVKGSADNDWQGAFAEFSDQIATRIGKTRDLVLSEFSTTGPIEKAASEIVLMDAMKQYFEYRMMTCCGIPEITLLGTVEDWKKIRTKAQVLAEYDLGWWTSELLPSLEHFVLAADGQVDRNVWSRFVKVPGGSGGTRVMGWINTFFPYLNGGKKSTFVRNPHLTPPDPNDRHVFERGPQDFDFPIGLSKVPFIWEYHAKEFPMEFIAGLCGVVQDPKTFAVSPIVGWAVQDQ